LLAIGNNVESSAVNEGRMKTDSHIGRYKILIKPVT
jgi:hypothetical protein